MPAKRILVSGRVQGVFFRNWTVAEARALGLAGWVRNLRTGAVEILAVGDAAALEALIAKCRTGPPAAVVRSLQVDDAQPQRLAGFSERPSA